MKRSVKDYGVCTQVTIRSIKFGARAAIDDSEHNRRQLAEYSIAVKGFRFKISHVGQIIILIIILGSIDYLL